MYGLLSNTYKNYRIENSTSNRESFRSKQSLSWTGKGGILLLELAFTVLVLLVLYDIYSVKHWPSWLLIVFLVVLFIPVIGDVLGILLILYWLLEIGLKRKSEILQNLM
jgi:hypothetical protein